MRRFASCVSAVGIVWLGIFPAILTAHSTSQNDLLAVRPQARILSPIDNDRRVVLRGNRHPVTASTAESTAVPSDKLLQHMVLVLRPSSEQQRALDKLVAAQQDPASSLYHRWLTPGSYAQRFGIADSDLEQIEAWLRQEGLRVDEVSASRRSIQFSGNVADVEATFQTSLRYYSTGSAVHLANASDPEIPAAMADVVEGVASLHNFFSRSLAEMKSTSPDYTTGSAHYLSPADFATIYDVRSLYNQGYDGTGQTVAIVARSNITQSDVTKFRSQFSLPGNAPHVILVNTDPGTGSGDFGEAMLDVEWSGAVAKGATIDFVAASSTAVSDGVLLSAQYIVNHNLAPVMSMSYGLCEADMGSTENSWINSLWQQAASQGISVFVSAGDSGAAGCDSASSTRATAGRAVNGLCTSPYSTCVGGTQFDDTSNPSLYWSSSNGSDSSSALGYIPEKVWNESGSSGLWSTGGGVSLIYTKPTWQNVSGVPADGMRDVPDVSLTSAGHVAYMVVMYGSTYEFYGTSAAAPSFAGLMSLVVQAHGAQGTANPTLYTLASRQLSAGGPAVFHDVVSGNNSVPGVNGFSATSGYDNASGLGSVDASVLVAHWADTTGAPGIALTSTVSSVTLLAGANTTVPVTTTMSGGLSAAVTLSLTGLPTGVTAAFTPSTIASPGSGASTLKFTASSAAVAGSYAVIVKGTGGGLTTTLPITLTIQPAPAFTITVSRNSAAILPGGSTTLNLTTAGNSTFNAAVALTPSGLPSGVTASLTPTSIASPGSGTSVLTLAASSSVAPGNYTLSITATGGGLASVVRIAVAIQGIVLKASASSAVYGSSVTFTATTYGMSQPTVAFYDGSTMLGSSAAGSTGVALFPTPALQPGIRSITATASGYSVTSAAVTVTVKAVVTVTANGASKIYGTANPIFSASYSGWVNGDNAGVLTGAPAFSTTANTASGVGSYAITPGTGTLAAANYTFRFVSGTLTVTAASPSVTLASSASSSVYGARIVFIATISSGGPAGTVMFYDGASSLGSANLSGTSATLTISTLNAGTHSITASLGGRNYNPATSPAISQTVTQALLTITAGTTMTYGANLALAPKYTGWMNRDSVGVLTGAPALSTTAATPPGAGSYTVTVAPGTLAAVNYTFQCVPGTLTVAKAVLTIRANNAIKATGVANPTFTATYSGWKNGDTTAVLTGAPGLTTRATTTSPPGSYPITASTGTLSTANYAFNFVAGTLTVTR